MPAVRSSIRPKSSSGFRRYAIALACVAAALGGALLLRPVAGTENVNLIFLMAVIGVAVRYGFGPSLAASIAGVLTYNFFFLEPIHTFEIAGPRNMAAFFFFLVVALITSHLAARARTEAIAARRRAETTEALYRFSRRIADITELDDLLQATLQQISSMLSVEGVLLLRDADGDLQVRAISPAADPPNALDLIAAQAAWLSRNSGDPSIRETLRAGNWLFVPLYTGEEVIGASGISRNWASDPLNAEERQLLGALVNHATVAIERIRVATERDEARLAAETERLRSTLLTSLSHDLKTPLASITGAATALRQYGELYDGAARDDLAETIQDEAERLTRFVINLLDMARLEAGGIAPNLQPMDLSDLIGTALQRTETLLKEHKVHVALDPDLPMLSLDPVLLEQVLVNLLDNAAKYAPPGSAISIEGQRRGDSVVLTVADEGAGLAPEDVGRVFDKFYRSGSGDRQRAGTGLGLSICRGFMAAMGGTITADSRPSPPGGAIFTIALPSTTFVSAPSSYEEAGA